MTTYTRESVLIQHAAQYKSELMNKMFGARSHLGTRVPSQYSGIRHGVGAVLFSGASAQSASTPATTNPLSELPPGNNIVGVGYGTKTTEGALIDGQIAVRVYVRMKLPAASVSADDFVPPDVNGTPTDIVAVGDITAYAHAWPVSCGVSVGHKHVTAGTLGCLVQKAGDPAYYILSNNHVFANTNACSIGDEIVQPGPLDSGTLIGSPNDVIAHLTDFEPITMVGLGSPPSLTPNAYDAAIAKLVSNADVLPDILSVGRAAVPTMPASLYQSVRKHGRTTLHTVGVITDVSAAIRVGYGTCVADFDDQIAIVGAGGVFSSGGDSGSLVMDAVSLQPVGMLFAGGGSTTFANPIDDVLARFGVAIL